MRRPRGNLQGGGKNALGLGMSAAKDSERRGSSDEGLVHKRQDASEKDAREARYRRKRCKSKSQKSDMPQFAC